MKLENPPGTRDFLPEEMIGRQEVIDRIKGVFETYGFSPFETPAFEYAEVLEGKYGEEEKLIYRFEDLGGRKLALRYDLTVPLARVFASNAIQTPFKRYCISRVWRFDRPQKGRYREFWQCDVDVVGSNSMKADAEIIACAIDALQAIGLTDFRFKINNRKLLDKILRAVGIPENKDIDAFRAIDKLEKKGLRNVVKELAERGIDNQQGKELLNLMEITDLAEIESKIGSCEGINELKEIFSILKKIKKDKNVSLDLSMVRGLDYYTGPIFEVGLGDYGSIAGGGRYDKLIAGFGKEAPAVGISLGIERILAVMGESGLLDKKRSVADVFVLCADKESSAEAFKVADELRRDKIKTDIDLSGRNFSNQLKYADRQGIKKVVIVGQKGLKEKMVTIKNMESGEQVDVSLERLNKEIKK